MSVRVLVPDWVILKVDFPLYWTVLSPIKEVTGKSEPMDQPYHLLI